MNQPRWKIWLSYLVELHIENAGSDYNPHLYVSLKQGRYQLSTANAVYSFEDLYTNFSLTFQALDLDRLRLRKVLLLGLGLGSIPVMLERTFHQHCDFTAVEVDAAVLYLASKYVLPDLKSGITLIEADALVFVSQCRETFDLICMDIFLDDTIPPEFEQSSFLENLRALLAPEGVLLYNRLAATSRDKRRSLQFFERKFLPVFPNGTYLDVAGNYMLISDRKALKKGQSRR
jgi:spermidine synthase